MGLLKLLKKKVIQIKIEIWSAWVSNIGPSRYEHHTLPTELAKYWYRNVLQINTFKPLIYAKDLKRESNPPKKRNLVRTSLEHRTSPLLAPRSTDWLLICKLIPN